MKLTATLLLPCCLVAAAQATWAPYSSSKGHFSIQMPAKPAEQSMQTPMAGKSYTTYLYIGADKSAAGMVSSTEIPLTNGDGQKAVRQGYIGAFLKNAKASETSRKTYSLHGYKGEMVEFATSQAKGSMWIFISGHRLYGVVALAPNSQDVASAKSHLFNSFKAS